MIKAMLSSKALTCVLLIVLIGSAGLAETVNINPHKIVLNAKGAADDVQANIHIALDSAWIVGFDVILALNGTIVAEAESAFYCMLDDILIVGFDRTSLQDNPDVQALANQTVTATVIGTVTVKNADGVETTVSFGGLDTVEIVAPSKKPK